MPPDGPAEVDLHVGRRIRQRRKALNVTQEALADALGLTFQQIQKYERGANRVSASKLYQVAAYLQTPVDYFFDGLADPTAQATAGETGFDRAINDFLMSPEGLEMAALFVRIEKPALRRQLVQLMRAMVDEPEG
ncbi:helix-turn-helix domain-containing protein [Caulobacter sp. SLTY]|uniref:helix-turn-helix domain-containing protein n=1 Tax=Caulobacter sp. SLTY TaxID=2683262 RepID=UPI001412ACAB|nr:helix-turn-helix domain-containing protein [Caulobacter sp. SLTY]NBB14591.1 helix-turn-helix domain-containing protein [Caulobacter sp. SLTY]